MSVSVPVHSWELILHSPYMIGANGSVRGKKEFEPSSLAAESEPCVPRRNSRLALHY
eukprot:COSAG02_NODE_3474_length_6681_cov_29.310696_3_plen_57_part_00